MGHFFGTDGIRGRAGSFPLDAMTVERIGFSLANHLRRETGGTVTILLGRDTRESGEWIEEMVALGIRTAGGQAVSAGVISTPGVAYLTRETGAAAGVVISASHNPSQDNGIKIFSPSGRKLSEQMEGAIEADLDPLTSRAHHPGTDIVVTSRGEATATFEPELSRRYLDYLRESVGRGLNLAGLTLTIDCANGAASRLAPELFTALGARLHLLHAAPDGRNINLNCGSLHPESLQQRVIETASDLGIAFDGDADRLLAVDERGELLDGDAILYILATALDRHQQLAKRRVVATVMSNLGLELTLKGLGIELVRTPVGDKYVLDELLRSGGSLGGEQSGHIIFPQISLAGDGMITGLELLRVMAESREPVSRLTAGFTRFPQVIINVPVARKPPLRSLPEINAAITVVEEQLSGSGRLLARYSGTENIARIMIEGRDELHIRHLAESLARTIATELGSP